MPVIAVVNRKGGTGKSTFAAHVAAWCACQGHAVMLGDVDRQQSSRAWLKRRRAGLPWIAPWAMDQKNVLRLPAGITHVVLDTPGGLQGFELARIVMFADAIVIPICASMFDREAAAACHAELMTLPRVASGRCRVAAVGMRIDGRTQGAQALSDWCTTSGIAFLGTLRETQSYVRALERGLTIFDLPAAQCGADLAQWAPIIEWLRLALEPVQAANHGPALRANTAHVATARPDSLRPAQEAFVHGSRLMVQSAARAAAAAHFAPAAILPRTTVEGRQLPQFLKR